MGFSNGNVKARFASILFIGHAAIRLKSQNFVWDLMEWDDLVTSTHKNFQSNDCQRRARADLDSYTQLSLSNIIGYINAFH